MMKCYILGVYLFLTIFSHLSESVPIRAKRDLKDDLIRRAQRLLTVASGEIRLLKDEGRDVEAKGLEALEVRLVQFELLLKTATDAQEIANLEMSLQGIEQELQTVLTSAGKDHVSNVELEKLIQKVQELNKKATEVVKRLKAQNNTLTASGIEREQIRLINLELDLRSAVKSEEIRRLAELLVELEQSFAELLADVNVTTKLRKRRQANPVRDQLIRRATDLIDRANAEIVVLQAANQTANVTLLQQEEATIQALVTELRAATTQTQITSIATRLNAAENRLDAELRRLDVEIVSAAERDAIIARAEALNARAAAEVAALRTANRTQLAAQLQAEETTIAQLVTQLRAARTATTIRQLEQRLAVAEARLEQELNAIATTIADPEKDALIKRADELINKTNVEINKLKSEGRVAEQALLETEEILVAEFVAELRRTNVTADVTRIKINLNTTLNRIEAEIKQLEAAVTTDAERDALLLRAGESVATALTTIYILKGKQKYLEAEVLQAEVDLVREVRTELINSRNDTLIKQLKAKLTTDLNKLDDTVKRFTAPESNNELKDSLLKKAEALDKKAVTALVDSIWEGFSSNLTELERLRTVINGLIASINSTTDTDALTKLEANLTNTEVLLNKEIERLYQLIDDAYIDELINKVEELAIRAKTAIRALRAQNKTLEADGLALEVEGLVVMDVLLRSATAEEARRVASQLVAVEKRVEQQLSQISQRRKRQAVSVDPEIVALNERARESLATAMTYIYVLKGKQKYLEADVLTAYVALVMEVREELNSAINVTIIKQLKEKLNRDLNLLDEKIKEFTPIAFPTSTTTRRKRDLKSDLLSNAVLLTSRANNEIAILNSQNRTAEAKLLEGLEATMKALAANLSATNNETEIQALVEDLGYAEGALLLALEQLGVPVDPEEWKRALIIYGEELINRANQEIAGLITKNKTSAVELIRAEEQSITLLIAQLRNATISQEVAHWELRLAQAEVKLQEELARLGIAWDAKAAKDFLIQRAQILHKQVNATITKLISEGRSEIVTGLQQEEQRIMAIIEQLKNATDEAVMDALEFSLEQAEYRLEVELSLLNVQTISRVERQAFINQIEELATRALIEARKLYAANRTLEAEGLYSEHLLLVELDVAVRNVINPIDLLYMENRFRQISARILNNLAALGVI